MKRATVKAREVPVGKDFFDADRVLKRKPRSHNRHSLQKMAMSRMSLQDVAHCQRVCLRYLERALSHKYRSLARAAPSDEDDPYHLALCGGNVLCVLNASSLPEIVGAFRQTYAAMCDHLDGGWGIDNCSPLHPMYVALNSLLSNMESET